MPAVGDYQDTGSPKPGATVLLNASVAGRRVPLLTTQQYGRGKVAVLATGATWKWQMLQNSKDNTHEAFWQQLARWLVMDSRGRVSSSIPKPLLADEENLRMTVDVRDTNYLPAADASVEARISGPDGLTEQVSLQADAKRPGTYVANWRAKSEGAYVTEVVAKRGEEEVGRDTIVFQRQDGTQEAFHPEQNRELLERIASETGGRYSTPEQAPELMRDIEFSDAGISVRETHDLWNAPAALLAIFGLKAAEWLLRRKWGAV
jgi:nitrogen fixation protein FixH